RSVVSYGHRMGVGKPGNTGTKHRSRASRARDGAELSYVLLGEGRRGAGKDGSSVGDRPVCKDDAVNVSPGYATDGPRACGANATEPEGNIAAAVHGAINKHVAVRRCGDR